MTATTVQSKPHRRVRLTPRDASALSVLYENCVMSFDQLHQNCYAGKSEKTAYNQLLRLKEGGFIDSHRMGIISYHKEIKDIGNVYRLNDRGLEVLRILIPETCLNDSMPLNTATLYHDLVLNEVVAAMKKRFPEYKFANGKHFHGVFQHERRVPDALMFGENDKVVAAVELELTAKSDRRYREIIMQYRLSRHFPTVIYVVGYGSIEEKMRALIAHKAVQGLSKPCTGKFYFVLLDELLKDPNQAVISNGSEDFCPLNRQSKSLMEGMS